MRKILFLNLLLILFFACDSSSAKIEQLWTNAEQFRTDDKLAESITELITIIKDFPEHDRAADAQFQIGEIYLNDVKDYEIAIEEFTKVIDNFSMSNMKTKALFMIGYIQANYLDAYGDAIENYRLFLEKYPDHELAPSVEYELDNMSDIIDETERLNDIAAERKKEGTPQ